MESIKEMHELAGVEFNSPIDSNINTEVDKLELFTKIVKIENNDEFSNIKDNLSDDSYLYTADEIYDIFTSDDEDKQSKVVELFKEAYNHRTFDVSDLTEIFNNEYDSLINYIFKNGVDLMKGEFEINKLDEQTCRDFIGTISRIELTDGSKIFSNGNYNYTMDDIALLSKGEVLEMQGSTKPIPVLISDTKGFIAGFDIVYKGEHGTVTFRVVNDKMAIKIGVGLNLIKFSFVEFKYLNETVTFSPLFNENLDKAKVCALVVSKLRKENTEDTKAYNIYDVFKMFGMTKYEQIGFFASIATKNIFDFSDYGRFDVRLLDSLKNGIPESIVNALELTTDNQTSELLERVEAMENEADDEDDPNVTIVRNTLQLFADIINEEFDPMKTMYVAELADRLDSSLDLGIACSHYIEDGLSAVDTYNKIKENCVLFKNKNKNLNYAAAMCYYTILAQRMDMAKYILFANEVTRECSFLQPNEQRHFGFSSTVIGISGLKRQCDMQNRIMRSSHFTYQLSNLKTAFSQEIDKATQLETPYIEMLQSNSSILIYYLIQYCYYIYKKDMEAVKNLPITITNGADNKVMILFDLSKLPIHLADEVIQINVEPSLIKSFSDIVEDNIKNCNVNPLSNKTDKNFMSTYDYLRLQFVQEATGVTMDFFCPNLFIDYDNIINADKLRTIKTMPITEPSIYGLSPFYRLGESVKGNIQDYYKTSVAANFDELGFQYQDAIQVLEACVDGLETVGAADSCLPPVVYSKKFIKDCYKSGRTLNHMVTRWDVNTASNKDLMHNLGYNIYTDANFNDDYKIENVDIVLSPEQMQFANYCVEKLRTKYEKYFKITDNDMIAIELEAKYLAVNCFDQSMISIFDKLKYAVISQNHIKEMRANGQAVTKEVQEKLQQDAVNEFNNMTQEQKQDIINKTYEVCLNRSSYALDVTTSIINRNTIQPNISVEPELIDGLKKYLDEYQPLSEVGNKGVFFDENIYSIFDQAVLDKLAFKVNDNNYILKLKNNIYNIIRERKVEI